MKVKGQEKPTANHIDLCKPARRLPSTGRGSIMLDHQQAQSGLMPLLCASTTSIHHVTHSGVISRCSLNCQQQWSWCCRHVYSATHTWTHTHTPTPLSGVFFTLSANDYTPRKLQSVWRMWERETEYLHGAQQKKHFGAAVELENQSLVPTTLHLIDGFHYLFLPQGKELRMPSSWSYQSPFIDQ